MSARFDVLFAGQLLEGRDAGTVRLNLGRLFKADEATLDKLFSGKPQILKRDADAATAHKYQQALATAGAHAVLRPCEDSAPVTAPAPAADAPQTGLALAPPGNDVLAPEERAPAIAPSINAPDLDVAAAGERLAEPASPAPAPAVDLSHLELAAVGADVLEEQYRKRDTTTPPDTSHLSLEE